MRKGLRPLLLASALTLVPVEPQAAQTAAAAFQYKTHYYYYNGEDGYCLYSTPPANATQLPAMDPQSIEGAHEQSMCGGANPPATVLTYSGNYYSYDGRSGYCLYPVPPANSGNAPVIDPESIRGATNRGLCSGSGNSRAPFRGPTGYLGQPVFSDAFGSTRPDGTVTSLDQFYPNTRYPSPDYPPKSLYGSNATGWDRWMRNWGCQPNSNIANIQLKSDHLEIYPSTYPAGFISSHFEWLPPPGHSVYFEIRAATGRGSFKSWPAIWLYAGNEANYGQTCRAGDIIIHQPEVDIVETSVNGQPGTSGPVATEHGAPYLSYFSTATHLGGTSEAPMLDYAYIATSGIDITTTYNIYGIEITRDRGHKLSWVMYFNGVKAAASKRPLSWTSSPLTLASPPSLFLGWNYNGSPYPNAVMKVDYVRVWAK